MRIVVGQRLTMRGHAWTVKRISEYDTTEMARISSVDLRLEHSRVANNLFQAPHYDEFEEGDIITSKISCIELTRPGDTFYIYTRYEARKELNYGSERSETGGEPAPTPEVEGSRVGGQDEDGTGRAGAD